jgi:hypothetical protein
VKKLGEGQTILVMLLLGFTLYFVVASLGYGKNSRLFPVAVGVPTALLTALALAEAWKPGLLRGAEVSFGTLPEGAASERAVEPAGRVLRMLGWLLLALVLIGLVGFSVTVPVYILIFARIEGRAGWKACLLTAIASWAFIVGYFDFFMQFRMFRGVLFGDTLPLL